MRMFGIFGMFYFMMVVFRKRVQGIFFDFDNMFVLILKVNLYVFYKVKDKLFEFFVEKDVENIVLKYQKFVIEIYLLLFDFFK